MHDTHISVNVGADRVLGFFYHFFTEGIPEFPLLYPVKHSNLTKTNLPAGIQGRDDLSSLSSLKTESHPMIFR